MHDFSLALDAALHGDHRRDQDGFAAFLKDFGPDDEIGDALSSFERYMHHALGASRAPRAGRANQRKNSAKSDDWTALGMAFVLSYQKADRPLAAPKRKCLISARGEIPIPLPDSRFGDRR